MFYSRRETYEGIPVPKYKRFIIMYTWYVCGGNALNIDISKRFLFTLIFIVKVKAIFQNKKKKICQKS